MNHEAQHSHLCGTALVELYGTLVELLLLSVVTDPSDREGRGREVSWEGGFVLLPSGELKKTAEGEDLEGTSHRGLEASGPATGDVGELGSVKRNVSWEANSSSGDEVSDNTKHADTAMLDLDVTKAVELFLVTVGNEAKGIKESERRLGTELVFEGHVEGRGGLASLGRGKGSGGGDKGGKNGELHG